MRNLEFTFNNCESVIQNVQGMLGGHYRICILSELDKAGEVIRIFEVFFFLFAIEYL